MMTSVYSDADYLAAYQQKRKIIGLFLGITVAYFIFCVAWVIYFTTLPYADDRQNLPKACVYIASALYVVFAVPYMAIKGSRVRKYFKMLTYLSEGLKNEERNYFYAFEKKSLQKDNIDVMGCVFETWSKKKCEWMDREAYWDVEKPLPPFESGDLVRYIVQSNFILQYDILQKKALEFEEVDEDEEYEDEDYVPEDTSDDAVETE